MTALSFYAYEHIRQDTGAVFYVGKGSGPRANLSTGRNQYWKRIVSKAKAFSARIIASNLDEELAHLVEIERINQCKRLNIPLCNLTDGGEGMSGYAIPEEIRNKISASLSGRVGTPLSDKAKNLLRVAKTGVPKSEETKQKLRLANLGKKASAEARKKMSLAHKGKKRSDEFRKKLGDARRGKSQPKLQCPHCSKIGGNSNMVRWHFSNCKQKVI